jgi:hypothetical protein
MLTIEVDVFSGRPNPTWMMTDQDEVKELLGSLREAGSAHSKPGAGFSGLGYREVRVTSMGDDERLSRLPREFAVGTTAARDLDSSGAIARQLIEGMTRHADVHLVAHDITPLDRGLQAFLLEELERFLSDPPRPKQPPPPPHPENPLRTTVPDQRCEQCEYEVSQYNPGFWNTPTVQPHNNCYNYARNWRTNTFAQPGRAHGAQTGNMSCPSVAKAARADGLVPRCKCLPDSEWPRRLMALVIWPGRDYHWYREQRGGFWGHKPGQTAARNWDSSGALIVDPETCARGNYVDFCEYFYAGKSVVIN